MRFQTAHTIFTRKSSSEPDKHRYLSEMRPISHQSRVFFRLKFTCGSKNLPLPCEHHSNMCSAFLGESVGRSFSNIKPISSSSSTNLSKSSSVCCQLPLWTCQTSTEPSFYMPKLLGTSWLSAEKIRGLPEVKSKHKSYTAKTSFSSAPLYSASKPE